jgi:signal transduction histidine kinase
MKPHIFGTSRWGVARTSTFRYAALVAALVIVSGLIIIGVSYVLAALWERQQQASAHREFDHLVGVYASGGTDALTAEINRRSAREPAGSPQRLFNTDHIYVLATRDSERAIAGNLPFWPTGWASLDGGQIAFAAPRTGFSPSDLRQIRASITTLDGGFRLLVGRDVEFIERISHWLEGAPVWLLLFGLLSGTLGGWVASRRMLGRIDEIRQSAELIMAGDISHRMPVSKHDDEFDRLSSTLNRMLGEIETLMQTVRRVTDDIAHDLRSPLTRIRQDLEAAQAEGRTDRMREMIADSIIEVDRMLATFNAMLTIATVGSGTLRIELEDVALDGILLDLEDLYRPMSEERGRSFRVAGGNGLKVRANRQLLFQALANLIDNAIKYAPRGGRVEVGAKGGDGMVEILVADDGPGIPEQDRARVLEPFVRLDRSRSEPGNGLGLALVAAIVKLHRARIVLADNAPGLRVSLLMPAAA